MWNALTSLREKMKSGGGTSDHSQPRLEAEPGNQSYNTQYDNTDNYHKEFVDTTINNFEHGTGNDLSPADDGDLFHLSSAPNVTKKTVRPVLARRLAKAAALTTFFNAACEGALQHRQQAAGRDGGSMQPNI